MSDQRDAQVRANAGQASGAHRARLAHDTGSGVFFDSRAWIVDAVLPPGEAPRPR